MLIGPTVSREFFGVGLFRTLRRTGSSRLLSTIPATRRPATLGTLEREQCVVQVPRPRQATIRR